MAVVQNKKLKEDSGHGDAPRTSMALAPPHALFSRHSAYLVWESAHGGATPFQVSLGLSPLSFESAYAV